MKYTRSGLEVKKLEDDEVYWEIRYQYMGKKYIVDVAANSAKEARRIFLEVLFGDWCIIDYINKKK
jgi:hypothetical protein